MNPRKIQDYFSEENSTNPELEGYLNIENIGEYFDNCLQVIVVRN